MSSWRPSGDPTAFTRFKYEMPQVDFSPPRRRTHQPPRNPKLPLANVAARRSPEELLLGALADMRQAMSQTEQCLNNVVLETRQDARDEATRLWKALGKEPPPPPGSQDHMSNAAEAAWHKKQKQRLRAIEERIELRNNEAAELRMRLRALGDDDFPIDGDGIHSMAAAASHPLDTVGAATRVQAHARGHQARQRGKDLRRGEPLSHSSPPRKTQGGAGRIKGVPFRAEGVPSRFESRRPSTPPSEKLDRALAAREAALDRELASFAPSAPGLPDNPSSDDEWRAVSWRLRDLPSHWLPPIDESAASSSEVREAMSVMQAGLSSLLGGVGEDDDEGDDVRVHSADEHAQMGKRAEAEAREALARAQFEMYDANGNGSIEMSELTKLLADTLGGLSADQCAEYAGRSSVNWTRSTAAPTGELVEGLPCLLRDALRRSTRGRICSQGCAEARKLAAGARARARGVCAVRRRRERHVEPAGAERASAGSAWQPRSRAHGRRVGADCG